MLRFGRFRFGARLVATAASLGLGGLLTWVMLVPVRPNFLGMVTSGALAVMFLGWGTTAVPEIREQWRRRADPLEALRPVRGPVASLPPARSPRPRPSSNASTPYGRIAWAALNLWFATMGASFTAGVVQGALGLHPLALVPLLLLFLVTLVPFCLLTLIGGLCMLVNRAPGLWDHPPIRR